jgi:hypothetical protein
VRRRSTSSSATRRVGEKQSSMGSSSLENSMFPSYFRPPFGISRHTLTRWEVKILALSHKPIEMQFFRPLTACESLMPDHLSAGSMKLWSLPLIVLCLKLQYSQNLWRPPGPPIAFYWQPGPAHGPLVCCDQ